VERGDIWHVNLNPTKGREQANPRYVLVLTPRAFNALGTPVVAPITSRFPFQVPAQTRQALSYVTSCVRWI
jgi:mRNA-degrading endonuclease toxin of MazEF toxin-antitoxin module